MGKTMARRHHTPVRTIGIFTSGGDSCGMNACLASAVETAIILGMKVYFIKRGYQGMVDGDIQEANLDMISGIEHRGGTIIKSARCKEFMQRKGRLKAAENLVKRGITALLAIGGDGTLTGADVLRAEWSGLLEELLTAKKITKEQRHDYNRLIIVGVVGSIDNDFFGTDMTLGTDTALHRIEVFMYNTATTQESHDRTTIFKFMGRNCGYLALVAAIMCRADFLFIPEDPPENWREALKKKIMRRRLKIIVMSEGAIDRSGQKVAPEDVKKFLLEYDATQSDERKKLDAKIADPNRSQRGGLTSPYDRVLGVKMGHAAVLSVIDAHKHPEQESQVVCINGNQMVRKSLQKCVMKTKEMKSAYEKRDYRKVLELRGINFKQQLEMYRFKSADRI